MAAVVNAWIDGTPWMVRVHSLEALEGFIRDAIPVREIWVAGDPVCAYLSCDAEASKVAALYSGKPGEGYGKALMDRVKEGRDYLWLHTHEPNEVAQRFYRREGFIEVSRHAPEPPEVTREVRMEWRR